MKKSKKGVTLVELVICCAITVMLAGACTAVLISGQRVWKSGSESANAQMTADILQTSLYGKLPSYGSVEVVSTANSTGVSTLKGSATGTLLYFNDEDVLVIQNSGDTMTVNDVTDFTYTFLKVGSKESARTQFNYTATLADGREFSGGIVISNLAFKDIDLSSMPTHNGTILSLDDISDTTKPLNLKENIFLFDATVDPDAGAGS